MSVTKLPVNISLDPRKTIIRQPLWLEDYNYAVWKKDLSAENLLAFSLSLFLLIAGVAWAFKKFGLTGLIPLILQVSYHIGNGFALTSGERYLEPVIWVTFLYYGVGIYAALVVLTQNKSVFSTLAARQSLPVEVPVQSTEQNPSRKRNAILVLLACIAAGSVLALVNLIPSTIESLSEDQLLAKSQTVLKNEMNLSDTAIDKFLDNPQAIIVEGVAFHPRMYPSPFQSWNTEVFELTVLGEDYVYVSNFLGSMPASRFDDQNRVILIGCNYRERNFWGADTILTRTAALIVLDGVKEDAVYTNPNFNFQCP